MKYQGILLIIVVSFSVFLVNNNFKRSESVAGIINAEEKNPNATQEEAKNTNFKNYITSYYQPEYQSTNFLNLDNGTSSQDSNQADNIDAQINQLSQNGNLNIDCNAIDAQSALLKNIDQNTDIFDLNADNRRPIASLTKLMTATIALENIDKNKIVTISDSAVTTFGEAGNLKSGEQYKISDLINAMLVVSSNDAAVALSEVIGQKDFLMLMNKKASELKMTQTYYLDPTGLSFLNQSSANDLVKLINYIYQSHPEIFKITQQKEIKISELKSKSKKILTNIDSFSGNLDFLGGKTGFTDAAGRNLAALFKQNNHVVLSIILGADNAFDQTSKMLSCHK